MNKSITVTDIKTHSGLRLSRARTIDTSRDSWFNLDLSPEQIKLMFEYKIKQLRQLDKENKLTLPE